MRRREEGNVKRDDRRDGRGRGAKLGKKVRLERWERREAKSRRKESLKI